MIQMIIFDTIDPYKIIREETLTLFFGVKNLAPNLVILILNKIYHSYTFI